MGVDKDWEKWGKQHPYFGVISHQQYLGKKLSKDKLKQFFSDGEAEVNNMFNRLNQLGAPKQFTLTVDYGCGVGRLSQALAKRSKQVLGLDISPSMVGEATRLAGNRTNLIFKSTNKRLINLPKSYDLLVSYIVFQHIPPRHGLNILNQLLNSLETGGYIAVQITYGLNMTKIDKVKHRLRRIKYLHYLLNLLKRRGLNYPQMRMYEYDLNKVYKIFQQNSITRHISELTDHGGHLGVFVYGTKDQI